MAASENRGSIIAVCWRQPRVIEAHGKMFQRRGVPQQRAFHLAASASLAFRKGLSLTL